MVGRQTIWVRKKQKQSTGDGWTRVEVGLLSGLHRMLTEDLSSEEICKQELKEREAANHMRNGGKSIPSRGNSQGKRCELEERMRACCALGISGRGRLE